MIKQNTTMIFRAGTTLIEKDTKECTIAAMADSIAEAFYGSTPDSTVKKSNVKRNYRLVLTVAKGQ